MITISKYFKGEIVMRKMILVPALLGVIGFGTVIGQTGANAAEVLTYDQIKQQALTEVNGIITDVGYEKNNVNSFYEFEIITSNTKYELQYDATTGELLNKQQKTLKSKELAKYSTVQPAFTIEQIQEKALAFVTGGTITSTEYEAYKGYYEVDVLTATAKYELKYSAITGELLKNKSKQFKYQSAPTANQTLLTVDAIKQKALALVAGTITKVKYENKGAQGYYEVKIVTTTTKYELKFNAVTGELVKQETDHHE